MNVRVKLFATLGRFSGQKMPGTPFQMELPEGAVLADLIRLLNLPEDEVKICFVNGRVQETAHALKNGDDIGIFPPIGGG